MKTNEDIESYLLRLNIPYESIADSMWRLGVAEHEDLVVSVAGPLAVFRLKVMEVPNKKREALFEKLLRYNTTDMVHGAFGLEDGNVVIVATLALENLDFNEFQSTIDDITLVVSRLYPELAPFREAA